MNKKDYAKYQRHINTKDGYKIISQETLGESVILDSGNNLEETLADTITANQIDAWFNENIGGINGITYGIYTTSELDDNVIVGEVEIK